MPENMESGGNPDAAQDEGLIQSVMQRELGPIFEAIGSRMKDLEEDLGEAKDLLYKFTQGLIGAADNHRRTSLSEELSTKYGKDMEPLEGFHKDVYGKGLSESLLEELMGDEGPGDDEREEWIKGKLGEAKGKFGKYVGIKAEEAPAESAPEGAGLEAPVPEATGVMEGTAKEEPTGGEEPPMESEEESGDEGGDTVSKLMNQMKSLGGEKHKLSEPLAKKKKKAKEAE
jgi:hypothetical protein